MTSNESAYDKLKQLQRALKLKDSDTGLVNEGIDGAQQLEPAGPKQEDVALYEEMYAEALQRQFPLRESDRTELEYYRQFFRIPEEESAAIEQQLIHHLQLSIDPPPDASSPIDQLVDRFPNASSATRDIYQPTNEPSDPGSTAPTLQNTHSAKGASANSGAVLKTAEQRFKANSGTAPGQTQPPVSQFQRSFAEAKSADPSGVAPTTDTTHQPSSSTPGENPTIASNPQGGSGSTTVMQPSPAQPPTANDNSAGSSPAQSSQEHPTTKVAETTTEVSANKPNQSVDESPATQRKSLLDKRVAVPLIAALCGLTALGVIIWMANSSLFQSKKRDPQAAEQLVQAGTTKNQQRLYREAINTFNDAIRLNPDSADAYINRGYAYHQLGDLSAAVNDYNRAIALAPNSAIAYNNLSHVQYDQKKYDEAAQLAQRAIELQQNLAEAHLNAGNALLALNNAEGALQKFEAVTRLPATKTTHAKALNNRGNILAARNQLEEARKQYDQAFQNDPNYADVSYNRGLVFERLNDRTAAIRDFTNAAKLYAAQNDERLSSQAQRRAEQLQKGSSPQPQQQPANKPNQRSI